MRTFNSVLLLVLATSCASNEPRSAWRLVGLYDSTALGALADNPEGTTSPWVPSTGMVDFCGPEKAPYGFGLTEAQAIESGLTPALVVLLRQDSPGRRDRLNTDNLRISLRTQGDPKHPLWRPVLTDERPDNAEGTFMCPLQPLVLPRSLQVSVVADDSAVAERGAALVRTQLRAELCLEHKTGRAWIGGSKAQIREAYLLDPPRYGEVTLDDDRRYFGGQGTPVPAYLGPPDACWSDNALNDEPGRPGGKGQGSLELTPTDVWDAELRRCERTSAPPGPPIALALGVQGGSASQLAPMKPVAVDVRVTGQGGDDRMVRVALFVDGKLRAEDDLFHDEQGGESDRSLWDALAHVPLDYPSLQLPHPPQDEASTQYAVLIIPNWQIVAGLKGVPDTSTAGWTGAEVEDGVGVLLRHPELLLVQVSAEDEPPATAQKTSVAWYNLTDNVVGEGWGWRDWGYATGHLWSREPIALPGPSLPSADQTREASRTNAHGLTLLCGALGLALLARGLRRLPDLITATPEERITWWPRQVSGPGSTKPKDEGVQ